MIASDNNTGDIGEKDQGERSSHDLRADGMIGWAKSWPSLEHFGTGLWNGGKENSRYKSPTGRSLEERLFSL